MCNLCFEDLLNNHSNLLITVIEATVAMIVSALPGLSKAFLKHRQFQTGQIFRQKDIPVTVVNKSNTFDTNQAGYANHSSV
jgi:hypothetical protein